MGSISRKGGSRWLVAGPLAVCLLAGAVVTLFEYDRSDVVGFGGLVIGLAYATTVMLRRSKALPARERRVWHLIAGGLALFLAGVFLVGILSELGVELAAFGPLDAFFITAYMFIVAALLLMARLESGGQEWVLTIMDAAVGGVALGALVWNAFFSDLLASLSSAPWWEVAIATIYPIADIMIVVGLLILVIRRSIYHLDIRLVFLAAGALAQVLADFLFMSRSIGQVFDGAEPAWPLNLMATAFLVMTAATVDRIPKKRVFPEAPTPFWALMWPYLLAASLLTLHFVKYRELNPGPSAILVLDAVIVIGVLIFMRQVYVIYRDRNRVDRKRAELVSSVSHELRTPLTAMVGFLTLLENHGDEFPRDAQAQMIGDAASQARHMSRLVADLLMLAKGDEATMGLEIERVGVMSIVLDVMRNAEPGDVRLEEEGSASVVISVDPDRIRQALSNLVSNAVRYGGDRCLIVTAVEEQDIVFEVHDNGQGVPTRFESMIWEQFERGEHRLDATTPGLGIGLSIVEAVATSHGGSAEYRRSELLGGSCFSLRLPDSVVPVASDHSVPTYS